MENEFYTDEFEHLIKEKADQFRMYPSKRVWHSIYNNLHPSRRWPSVVMSLLLITSLMLIGHLNTGDNNITRQINNIADNHTSKEINTIQSSNNQKQNFTYSKPQHPSVKGYENVFEDVIMNETDFYAYTIVKNNRPIYLNTANAVVDPNTTADKITIENNDKEKDLIQSMDSYIKSNQILNDVAANNKKKTTNNPKTTAKNINSEANAEDNHIPNINTTAINKSASIKPLTGNSTKAIIDKPTEKDKKGIAAVSSLKDKNILTNEEKAWIENFAFQNTPAKNKWKGRISFSLYATPAVNYRKLSTESKGSTTPFAMADINKVISQKPGLGIETGLGLTYAFAKRIQLKAGFQFNYTNYNIDADQINHPIITTILLNDPTTGYSYSAARTSTISNPYNSTALSPVKLHNQTYQVSIPVGFAYKLSSQNNVDWFAGASVQPTYIFGGNAHLISSDLKSYVSDPSSINSWNLNLGFETYMNFKMGSYHLQVGPQVRYQVNSTYRKNVALIEKPYAVGLKFGFTKAF